MVKWILLSWLFFMALTFPGMLFKLREQKDDPTSPPASNKPEHRSDPSGLSQYETFGRNILGEIAEVVLNCPERNVHKVIVNKNGFFEDFPGIIQGKWAEEIVGNFDFDEGKINYLTGFERKENGYRCLWEIQPDGRYWADDDGYGMTSDLEIVLYSDLDEDGNFTSPFRLYKLGGKRVNEKEY